MDINERINYWIELSKYDFDTAKVMLDSNRLLYVGFMCQQSVEKALKALYTKIYKEIPPKTHSLSYLINKIGIEDEMSDYFLEIVDKLEPLNIEARYPTYKDEIFELLTKEYCQTIYKQTSELLIWIKSKL